MEKQDYRKLMRLNVKKQNCEKFNWCISSEFYLLECTAL